MKNLLLLLLVFSIFIGCEKEGIIKIPDGEIPEPPIDLFEGNVTLQNLVVGQKSMFKYYESNCEDLHAAFKYTGDTLVWEVIEADGELALKEEYSDHSPSKINNPGMTPIIYPVATLEDGILLKDRFYSRMFYFYGNDTLRLHRDYDVELTQSHCMIATPDSLFTGDEMGHIKEFVIGDMTVSDKTAVSCVPIIDVDAYILYDDNHMYASHIVTSSEFGGVVDKFITGWEFIPK